MDWKQFLRDRPQLFKKENLCGRGPFYGRRITHSMSPYLVYVCLKMGITPDQVTAFSMVLGWVASILFAIPSRTSVLLGALSLEACYVFDSVDGQLARMTGKCSKTGAFYDTLVNYLVHPLVFISIGLGQYRVTGNWIFMLCGTLSGLAYVWLGLMWEVRAHILWESQRSSEPSFKTDPVKKEKRRSLARSFFSFLHKLCTFPPVMNLISFTAVLEFFTNKLFLPGYLIGFYGVAIPFVSLSKIAKMLLDHELDKEFN